MLPEIEYKPRVRATINNHGQPTRHINVSEHAHEMLMGIKAALTTSEWTPALDDVISLVLRSAPKTQTPRTNGAMEGTREI
jgi:hypothetical protein